MHQQKVRNLQPSIRTTSTAKRSQPSIEKQAVRTMQVQTVLILPGLNR